MREQELIQAILTQVQKAVLGKGPLLARVLLAVLARGHVLLEDIPGVGQVRRKALLQHFGTVKAIRAASLADLELAVPPSVARKVYEHFHHQQS